MKDGDEIVGKPLEKLRSTLIKEAIEKCNIGELIAGLPEHLRASEDIWTERFTKVLEGLPKPELIDVDLAGLITSRAKECTEASLKQKTLKSAREALTQLGLELVDANSLLDTIIAKEKKRLNDSDDALQTPATLKTIKEVESLPLLLDVIEPLDLVKLKWNLYFDKFVPTLPTKLPLKKRYEKFLISKYSPLPDTYKRIFLLHQKYSLPDISNFLDQASALDADIFEEMISVLIRAYKEHKDLDSSNRPVLGNYPGLKTVVEFEEMLEKSKDEFSAPGESSRHDVEDFYNTIAEVRTLIKLRTPWISDRNVRKHIKAQGKKQSRIEPRHTTGSIQMRELHAGDEAVENGLFNTDKIMSAIYEKEIGRHNRPLRKLLKNDIFKLKEVGSAEEFKSFLSGVYKNLESIKQIKQYNLTLKELDQALHDFPNINQDDFENIFKSPFFRDNPDAIEFHNLVIQEAFIDRNAANEADKYALREIISQPEPKVKESGMEMEDSGDEELLDEEIEEVKEVKKTVQKLRGKEEILKKIQDFAITKIASEENITSLERSLDTRNIFQEGFLKHLIANSIKSKPAHELITLINHEDKEKVVLSLFDEYYEKLKVEVSSVNFNSATDFLIWDRNVHGDKCNKFIKDIVIKKAIDIIKDRLRGSEFDHKDNKDDLNNFFDNVSSESDLSLEAISKGISQQYIVGIIEIKCKNFIQEFLEKYKPELIIKSEQKRLLENTIRYFTEKSKDPRFDFNNLSNDELFSILKPLVIFRTAEHFNEYHFDKVFAGDEFYKFKQLSFSEIQEYLKSPLFEDIYSIEDAYSLSFMNFKTAYSLKEKNTSDAEPDSKKIRSEYLYSINSPLPPALKQILKLGNGKEKIEPFYSIFNTIKSSFDSNPDEAYFIRCVKRLNNLFSKLTKGVRESPLKQEINYTLKTEEPIFGLSEDQLETLINEVQDLSLISHDNPDNLKRSLPFVLKDQRQAFNSFLERDAQTKKTNTTYLRFQKTIDFTSFKRMADIASNALQSVSPEHPLTQRQKQILQQHLELSDDVTQNFDSVIEHIDKYVNKIHGIVSRLDHALEIATVDFAQKAIKKEISIYLGKMQQAEMCKYNLIKINTLLQDRDLQDKLSAAQQALETFKYQPTKLKLRGFDPITVSSEEDVVNQIQKIRGYDANLTRDDQPLKDDSLQPRVAAAIGDVSDSNAPMSAYMSTFAGQHGETSVIPISASFQYENGSYYETRDALVSRGGIVTVPNLTSGTELFKEVDKNGAPVSDDKISSNNFKPKYLYLVRVQKAMQAIMQFMVNRAEKRPGQRKVEIYCRDVEHAALFYKAAKLLKVKYPIKLSGIDHRSKQGMVFKSNTAKVRMYNHVTRKMLGGADINVGLDDFPQSIQDKVEHFSKHMKQRRSQLKERKSGSGNDAVMAKYRKAMSKAVKNESPSSTIIRKP